MLRTKFFKQFTLTLAIGIVPLSAASHTLGEALETAYTNSQLLVQQRNLTRAANQDAVIAASAYRPVINFLANATHTENTSNFHSLVTTLQLQADMLLLDGGQRKSNLEAARATVKAAEFALREQEQAVLLNAASAYLTLRQSKQAVALRESNLRLLQEQLRATQDRFDVGEVTRTDVALAQSRLAFAQSQLAAARGQVSVSEATYKLAVGEAPHGVSAPKTSPALPASQNEAQAIALRLHPSISRQQHTVKAAELLAKAADQSRFGSLSARATANSVTNHDGSFNEGESASFGLSFNQPIYSGGAINANSAKARAQLEVSRAILAQQGMIVSQNVSQAWAQRSIARAQLVASRKQVEAAQLAFEGTREEVNVGARTTLDVLNAEQELLNARTSALSAATDAQIATYQVLAAMGLMTAKHLGLDIPATQ